MEQLPVHATSAIFFFLRKKAKHTMTQVTMIRLFDHPSSSNKKQFRHGSKLNFRQSTLTEHRLQSKYKTLSTDFRKVNPEGWKSLLGSLESNIN